MFATRTMLRASCMSGGSAAALLRRLPPYGSRLSPALCLQSRGAVGDSPAGATATTRAAGSDDGVAAATADAARSAAPSLGDQMREKGFVNATPNFTMDFTQSAEDAAALAAELVTEPALEVDLVRDLYGPWLVMTTDLQGELFVDHDAFVFYRPANGLGYGIGTLQLIPAGATGTAFRLELESYAYEQKASFAPRYGITMHVTGMVQKVHSAKADYTTFTLVGAWSKTDRNATAAAATAQEGTAASEAGTAKTRQDASATPLSSGQFNCAKISPWSASTAPDVQRAWRPNAELRAVFDQVFPDKLVLTSHLQRAAAAAPTAAEADEATTGPHHLQLEKYAVGALPGVYYIPDYISAEEERQMLALIKNTPAELKSKVKKRTVQEWGCSMCEECKQSFVSDANMPPWVQQCTDMLVYDGIFSPATFPNSVRIHEYEKGEGIGPHCDGPIYVPIVTVLSMASTTIMNFYPRRAPYLDHPMDHYNDTFVFGEGEIGKQTPLQSVVMEPRSLLVFSGEAYYYYPHGVSDKAVDHLTREECGEVVNRHLLRNKDLTELPREYRVSITTRNLLTRCNHQPSRAEYNMKRAWYLYHQQPIPDPLFGPAPVTQCDATTPAPAALPSPHRGPLSDVQLQDWHDRLDAIAAQQEALRQSMDEVRRTLAAFVAGEAEYRKETSFVLNQLSSSVLDLDAKLEDVADMLRPAGKETKDDTKSSTITTDQP